MNKQYGQAMTEFILYGSFIFIPMFLLLPSLAKYTELQQKTEEASRYAVWERTVWSDQGAGWGEGEHKKTDQQIQDEMTRRIFGHPLEGINAQTGTHPFWKDGKGQPMVKSVNLTQLREYNETEARMSAFGGVEQVAYLGKGVYAAANAVTLGTLKPYGLGLGSRNYVRADVQVFTTNVTKDLLPDDGDPTNDPADQLTLNASAAIFSNSWSANTPNTFYNRVDGIVADEVVQLIQFPADILCTLSLPFPGASDKVPYGEGCKANPVNAQVDWKQLPAVRQPGP